MFEDFYKIYNSVNNFFAKIIQKAQTVLAERFVSVVIGLSVFTLTLCASLYIVVTVVVPHLDEFYNMPTTSSKPGEDVSSAATQAEVISKAPVPTAASNATKAPSATLPPTEAVPALPPEGTWLVTPEDSSSSDCGMSGKVTAPFNVKVSYDGDATALIIKHPEGVLSVDQQETSPTVLYTGADAIAQYELEYNPAGDGTMSVTETIAIYGSPCVILYGSMEYQGPVD